MNFQMYAFHPAVSAGIAAAGYVTPTPIQAQAIDPILKGRDVMGLAQTGTGKTAAFALPLLQRFVQGRRGHVRALIIAPTRELASQIQQDIDTLGRKTRLRSAAIYGGVSINPQIQNLKREIDFVVACPGRLLDHIQRGTVDLSRVEALVLDEADQMFDMGFLPDIRRILKYLPAQRQALLFSATMPAAIRHLADDILTRPAVVQAGSNAPAATVSHALYPVAPHLKTDLLLELLPEAKAGAVLVFTRTKHRAKRLGEKLSRAGYRSACLQGNLSQNRRQAAMDGFRDGSVQVLVATDIAARGIDVSKVSHVINYDVPSTPEIYIHRIGRTGRADCSGDAYTLITDEDASMVRAIKHLLGKPIEQRRVPGFDYQRSAPSAKQAVSQPQDRVNHRRKPRRGAVVARSQRPADRSTKRGNTFGLPRPSAS